MSIEYGRFGSPLPRKKNWCEKPRQEISPFLKYLVFGLNFVFLLLAILSITLGVYLSYNELRPMSELADIVLNPAILLLLIGLTVGSVAALGTFGALRDNICMLKSFALALFMCYILLVVLTFVLFILFYSDTTEGLSAHSILLNSIRRYHQNANLADFINYVQEQLSCCGATSTSQGYKDWRSSVQFNCSLANRHPERCGVPFSCCKKPFVSHDKSASSSSPTLLSPAMRSLECWQNAQQKQLQELESLINIQGCLQPLKSVFEGNAVLIGAVIGVIIIPVSFSVCLANVLAKQIDRQKFLLERERRRAERRHRRNRRRYRDPFVVVNGDAISAQKPKKCRRETIFWSENATNEADEGHWPDRTPTRRRRRRRRARSEKNTRQREKHSQTEQCFSC